MQVNPKLSILKVLVYFDVFNYPVSKDEIQFFLDHRIPSVDLDNSLVILVNEGWIFRYEEFYSIRDDHALVERRKKGNRQAQALMVTAIKAAAFLSRFPYVRGIGISGSLSKNYATEKEDIDFFIITKANRLWIARTIMHLFKKFTFLAGRQHWFCMNYYVDEDALQIEEKNVFTATELFTLVPVCGNGAMVKFFNANAWAKAYYPNYELKTVEAGGLSGSWIKKNIELLFNNRRGDLLDDYLMKVTTLRWHKKEENQKLNIKGRRMGLRTGKHFSKPNPAFFQEKVLQRYKHKLHELEEAWNVEFIMDT